MKTCFRRWAILAVANTAWLSLVAVVANLLVNTNAMALPRSPLPPWPEANVLYQEGFDQPYHSEAGQPVDPTVWLESWSGYALNRSSQQPVVTPWVVPMLATNGSWNLDPQRGAFRMWYQPDSGLGSGSPATLLTLVSSAAGVSSAVWWTLSISADGESVVLACETGSGPSVCLSAPVAFQSGGWYLLTLAYTQTNTLLLINDQQAATGVGLPSVPPEVASSTRLVIGSTLSGDLVACGQIEAFTAFTSQPRPWRPALLDPTFGVAAYYTAYSSRAALGPITDLELAARAQARALQVATRQATSPLATMENSEGQGPLEWESGWCGTNSVYDVWLANIVVWSGAEGCWNTALTIGGGTNGAIYDLFRATAMLEGSITNWPWVWLTNAYACDTVTLSNEPAFALYILGTPLDSDGDGIPDAYSSLVHDGLGPDSNGNGVPDWLERAMGYDPRQPNDLGKTQPGYSLFLAQPRGTALLP